MKKILVSWVGTQDIETKSGPVAAVLSSHLFDEVYLLSAYSQEINQTFSKKIKSLSLSKFILCPVVLDNPTDYKSIYLIVTGLIEKILEKESTPVQWHFHTSPGTSQMNSVFLLLGKTKYPATLYQSWIEKQTGEERVREIDFPFRIELEIIQQWFEHPDQTLQKNWESIPEFQAVIHQSKKMKETLDLIFLAGVRDVPVLLLGESGSGKELAARALLSSSKRKSNPFEVFNCGAMPESLIESTLFGWSKGAYTDAKNEGTGILKKADGGTLFLDEIGDLPLSVQVKLLRFLQEKEFKRLGDGKTIYSDVRIIAATHKNLLEMVSEGSFRQDLFYRLAVAVIQIPPLSERKEDIKLIAEFFLKKINQELSSFTDRIPYYPKKISEKGISFLETHEWKGNIRELYNTIKRICLWEQKEWIDEKLIQKHLIIIPEKHLSQELPVLSSDTCFDLEEYLDHIKKEMIQKAFDLSGNVKSKAAKMLGYSNYQSIDYFLEKQKNL